jgi:hypothetical protein
MLRAKIFNWKRVELVLSIMQCSNCGAQARQSRGDYPFTDIKPRQVVLKDVELIQCDCCGNEDVIVPQLSSLMAALSDLEPSGSEDAISFSYAPGKGWFARP